MSREFVGTGHNGYKGPVRYDVHVEDGSKRYRLTQQVQGVHTSFRWDGAGPASNDVARALLWATTGVEPTWHMYRLFKTQVVSAWPRRVGECWRISDREITQWLAGVERGTALTEDAGQTQARWLQTHARELKVKAFARMFKSRG